MEISYKKSLETSKYGLGQDSASLKVDESGLGKLLNSKTPLVLEDFEGSMWMRGSCGTRPC